MIVYTLYRHVSIDSSEARINAVKKGDLVANVAFQTEDGGRSTDMTLSTIVNDGNNVAIFNTNNNLQWYSPSNAWIETGIIDVHSDFYIIDSVQWNASVLVEYSPDQYLFYANDYSSNGDEKFLIYGYGRFDVQSATSW